MDRELIILLSSSCNDNSNKNNILLCITITKYVKDRAGQKNLFKSDRDIKNFYLPIPRTFFLTSFPTIEKVWNTSSQPCDFASSPFPLLTKKLASLARAVCNFVPCNSNDVSRHKTKVCVPKMIVLCINGQREGLPVIVSLLKTFKKGG